MKTLILMMLSKYGWFRDKSYPVMGIRLSGSFNLSHIEFEVFGT